MLELRGLTKIELRNLLKTWGYPLYRGDQVFQWVQRKRVSEVCEMKNVPATLQKRLLEETYLANIEPIKNCKSRDGAEKFLFKLIDGEAVEAVLMYHPNRTTLCISSQVGCHFNCSFCATARMGLKRNLTAGEIVGQVIAAQNLIGQPRISNLVYMGMGEPLDNLFAVLKSLDIINHPEGLGLGARRITISTCGLVPRIYQLAERRLQIVLAVSLHAADDDLRNRLVPINRKYPLKELVDACRAYFQANRRRISFEYALIEQVNDSPVDARKLVKLLRGLPAHVNLMPANTIPGLPHRPSPPHRIRDFIKVLAEASLEVTQREVMGTEIEAACGQLHSSIEGEET